MPICPNNAYPCAKQGNKFRGYYSRTSGVKKIIEMIHFWIDLILFENLFKKLGITRRTGIYQKQSDSWYVKGEKSEKQLLICQRD